MPGQICERITMTEYDKMRQSDEFDDDGVEFDEYCDEEKSEEEKYFEFYDDLKRTPKDDW